MEVDIKKLSEQVKSIDGDVYLITKTLTVQAELIKDLTAKYELLLNRVKCAECHVRNETERDPDLGPEVTY